MSTLIRYPTSLNLTFATVPSLPVAGPEAVKDFYNSIVKLSAKDVIRLEFKTLAQAESPLWKTARLYRLTASTAKSVVFRHPSTSPIGFFEIQTSSCMPV